MRSFKIKADERELKGTAACSRLRRQGMLPGVVYGANGDSVLLSLSAHELTLSLEHEAFYSHILTLDIGGKEEKVVLKDIQRHPSNSSLEHIDFLRISEDKPIVIKIPLHFVNEDKCVGIKTQGGISSHIMTEIEVECLPKDLPEYMEIDMQDMNVGETIHIGDIKPPAGVEITSLKHGGDAAQPVVSVYVPKVAQEPEEEAAAEAAEEGEAAATEESKAAEDGAEK